MEVNSSEFSSNTNTKGSALLIDGNMRLQKVIVSFYQVVIANNEAQSTGGGILIGSNLWNIQFTIIELQCLANTAICTF